MGNKKVTEEKASYVWDWKLSKTKDFGILECGTYYYFAVENMKEINRERVHQYNHFAFKLRKRWVKLGFLIFLSWLDPKFQIVQLF